jgi:hypothetical protein
MKDQHQRAAYLSAGRGEVHGWSARDNDMLPSRAPNLFAVRCFQAGFPGQGVPSLGTGMGVGRRSHARREHCFHVLGRVSPAGMNRKRSNLGDMFSTRCTPSCVRNGEQPHLAHRLNHGPSLVSRGLGSGAAGIGCQMPEDLRLAQLPKRMVG